MLPSLQLLEKVSKEIMSVPNRRKESKRRVHFCLFLMGYKAGLRISEAVNFDLANRTRKGLYWIERTKGKKERLVYIPKKVIRELRKHNWQPNQTNRWNFYHFLRKIKRELGISKEIELSPHTLRRSFTTYQAESGLPLPILQKLLGHSSIRTTALYWQNIYRGDDDDNDTADILTGKNWLERKQPPPTTENFPEVLGTPKPIFTINQPVIPNKNPPVEDNSLSTPKTSKKTLGMLTNEISPRIPEKFFLNPADKKNSQPLALTANNEEKPSKKETILLAKIKQLEEQLKQVQAENEKLKFGKEKAEQLAQHERKRANQLEIKLKTVAQILCQLQKINYYKQLDQEQKAQIEQPPFKPPNK